MNALAKLKARCHAEVDAEVDADIFRMLLDADDNQILAMQTHFENRGMTEVAEIFDLYRHITPNQRQRLAAYFADKAGAK